MAKKQMRQFCISATFTGTIEEALKHLDNYERQGGLKKGTKIVEVKRIYEPTHTWATKEEKL